MRAVDEFAFSGLIEPLVEPLPLKSTVGTAAKITALEVLLPVGESVAVGAKLVLVPRRSLETRRFPVLTGE